MFRNYSCLFIILFSIKLISQERDSNNYTFNGNKFAEKEVFDEAEMSYRKAISSKPDNSKALYNLGNTHYKEKDFDEAAQRYFKSIKRFTTWVMCLCNRKNMLRQLKPIKMP